MPRLLSPNQYVTKTMPEIEGWLSETSAHLVIATSDLQETLGITGSVAEIGVHQGRLFVLLDLLRRDGDQALAIDVFEKQNLNIDSSGRGDRKVLERNLCRVGRAITDIRLIENSSLDVSPKDIRNLVGPIRIFSVDGGHTPKIVQNDLHLAQDSLAPGGVVLVDDAFNWMWPGVAEGLSHCLNDEAFQLRPIALTQEKLLLTHSDYVEEYTQGLEALMKTIPTSPCVQIKQFYGSSILIFWEHTKAVKRQIAIGAHPMYRRIRRSRVAELLRPMAIRVNRRLP